MDNEQQLMHHDHEMDELSLKELILSIWLQRKLVIGVTAGIFFLSAIYAFFFMAPEYRTETGLMFRIPKTESGTAGFETQYGTYIMPSEFIGDYTGYVYNEETVSQVIRDNNLDTTVEAFNKHIEVTLGEESSRFDIAFTYDDPQMAYEISRDLVDAFVLNMRVTFKLHALHDFQNDFATKAINAQKQIEQKESMQKGLQALQASVDPVYTLQKLLASDPVTAAAIAESMGIDVTQLADEVMVEEYANENYFTVEAQVLENEISLIQLREELAGYEKNKQEIEDKLNAYEAQKADGDLTAFLEDDMRVLSQNLMIASPPIMPTSPSGTGKVLVLAIGAVLGMMGGIFVGLFAQYWKSN